MFIIQRIIFFLLASLLVCTTGCKKEEKGAGTGQKQVGAAVEGAVAPDFTVKDLTGKEVSLASLKGKVVFVNFWATWCPPCKEEMPSMVKLNQSMTGKQFQMMAISIDEGGKEAVEGYFKQSGLSLPAYLDSEGTVSRNYGTTGVPETFIVDKSGVIRKKIVGGMNWASPDVIAYMEELLKK